MSIRDNFKKGYLEMLILILLDKEDMYGYQMSQSIIERGGGDIKIPEGSMYPTLHKLQDRKMISSYEKQVGKRQKRVYYHIEEEGRLYLNQMKEEFYIVNNCIIKILEY